MGLCCFAPPSISWINGSGFAQNDSSRRCRPPTGAHADGSYSHKGHAFVRRTEQVKTDHLRAFFVGHFCGHLWLAGVKLRFCLLCASYPLWAAEIDGPLIFFKRSKVGPRNPRCFSLFWLHTLQKLLLCLGTANLADQHQIIARQTMERLCCSHTPKTRGNSGKKTKRQFCRCNSFRRVQYAQFMYK